MARVSNRRNVDWETPAEPQLTWEQVGIEVMMDIREELKKLNALLNCRNFLEIPITLRRIARDTAKKKRKRTSVVRKTASLKRAPS